MWQGSVCGWHYYGRQCLEWGRWIFLNALVTRRIGMVRLQQTGAQMPVRQEMSLLMRVCFAWHLREIDRWVLIAKGNKPPDSGLLGSTAANILVLQIITKEYFSNEDHNQSVGQLLFKRNQHHCNYPYCKEMIQGAIRFWQDYPSVTYQLPNRNKLLAFCFTLTRRRENAPAYSCKKKETWNHRHGCTLSLLFLLMDGLTCSSDQTKCCNFTCISLSAINLTCVDDSVSQSLTVDNLSTCR